MPATVAAALLVGVAASIALGITAGPLTDLFTTAASQLGSVPMTPESSRCTAGFSRRRRAERAEELLANGFRLALVAAHDDGDRLRVVYLFLAGRPDRRVELERIVPAGDPSLPSLAYLSFPASRFEREMLDLYGIRPIGHPQPRRLVRHAHWPEGWHPMRADAGPRTAVRADRAVSRSSPSKAPGCTRSRSARYTPA